MNDENLHRLMHLARSAQGQLDLSARTFGFETRLSARLADPGHHGIGVVQLLWRAVAGCAAVVGMLAVWFILSTAPQAAEDDLASFWDVGQASYDSEILN